MSVVKPLTFAVLGAGGRGHYFASWLRDHPDAGSVVAVAEPDPGRRERLAKLCSLPAEMQFESWERLLSRPKLADAVIDTLMDRLHAPSAVQALRQGYHMLLEKPMATTLEDCIAIDDARRANGRIVSVCHSLRYHCVYSKVKQLLEAGAIGEIVSFDQLEGVEPVHQSHSFVRGNWGNEGRSTFMLLAKSCHDVDLVAWFVGRPCRRVSSFGSLSYFRREHAPPDAADRCTDNCPREPDCMYSALKLYSTCEGWGQWAKLPDDRLRRIEGLKTSPFGRCVWKSDNDVVDHQVVAFEFAGGVTGTFTMTAFWRPGGRRLRLHGTLGAMEADLETNTIRLHQYADDSQHQIKIPEQAGGHGGADSNVMHNLIHALRTNNPDAVLTTTAESLASHRIVFAAELARREGRVVELRELEAEHAAQRSLQSA